ncbi:MAG: HindIII family type II restriction endonuclease [Rhodocyclaceae bacterium]|nr:HindIII family type II restriction endonuclease [Rhodocyclaceae bacterium]
MKFKELKREIASCANQGFVAASDHLERIILGLGKGEVEALLTEIGTIPEEVGHDTTEEKLYAKASDIVFARALKEMNLEVEILRKRADCADIVAQSRYHGYSLVGDAKAFRLSRTAKNAKDFKIASMEHWRGDSDFSVLVCPYYHYPQSKSQIYKDALEKSVTLFSWEYLYIFLKEGVRETEQNSLKELWNAPATIAAQSSLLGAKTNFIPLQNGIVARTTGISDDKFDGHLADIKEIIAKRGNEEIRYYEREIERIRGLGKDEAIRELLASKKLDSRVDTIKNFIGQIRA